MKFGIEHYRGSGTLISSNIIITAAHNFYNEKLGLAHSLEFLAVEWEKLPSKIINF